MNPTTPKHELMIVPPEPIEMDIATAMLKMQADVMRKVTLQLPLNAHGLPEGVYNPKAILDLGWSPEDEDAVPPQEAWIPLDYSEGYPTFGAAAIPFWERLEGESGKYHDFFKAYVGLEGVRSTFSLSSFPNISSIGGNATLLASLKEVYYWEYRAKAFDLYIHAARTRHRALAARNTEDGHLIFSRELVDQAKGLLKERMGSISEQGLINLLKTGLQLERISVGLPAAGVSAQSASPTNITDIKTIINHYAQEEVRSGEVTTDSGKKMLARALKDPKTAELMQRLALRVNNIELTPPEDPVEDDEIDAAEEAASIMANPTGFSG